MACHSNYTKSDHGSIWKQQPKISRCIRSFCVPSADVGIVFMEGEKMKLVVNEWKKETGDKLIELGFTY